MRVHDAVITSLGRRDLIAPRENKAMRRDNAHGVVTGVMGKRDVVYLVLHEGAVTPAVYLEGELRLEPNAYWKLTYVQHGLGYFVELPTHDEVVDMLERLDDEGAKGVVVEGPFFSDKELTEGLVVTKGLFDRLKDD